MTVIDTDTWGESHIGCKRKTNEDRFLIKELPGLMILAVADGMGGHAGGEVAAQIVIDAFAEYNFSKDNVKNDLKSALETAQKNILYKSSRNFDLDGMGSTATTMALFQNKAFWVHVGDSRIYLLHDKKIRQITTDHTFMQDLIEDGAISLEQAEKHPLKNLLDQCVGCDEIHPDTGMLTLRKNDRILLCSDGLTRHLPDVQIESILMVNPVQRAGQQLIRTALEMGGADNVTVIVKKI